MDAFTKASPQFISAQQTCHRTGSAFEVLSSPRKGSVLQLVANVFAVGCFLFLAFVMLSSLRPGPTSYADAARSSGAAPNQFSATKGESQ